MRYGTSTAPKQPTNYERRATKACSCRAMQIRRSWWRSTAAARFSHRFAAIRPLQARGSNCSGVSRRSTTRAIRANRASARSSANAASMRNSSRRCCCTHIPVRRGMRERGFRARTNGLTRNCSCVWESRRRRWSRANSGANGALPPDLRLEFQETGTVHVLVTAGLHLGAVAALALALFSLGTPPRRRYVRARDRCRLGFCAQWSGAQLPAMRAAVMVTVALTARAFGRSALSWNALAIAAAFVALVRPESVATASFALSFSCVGAIFAVAKPLERRMHALTALPMPVREAIVLSIATQLGTWPLSASIFLQFAAYSPFANLGVVPCVAATMALGAAQLALAWCAPLAQACANLNSWLLAWMLAVVRTLSSLPGASVPMTPAPAWCVALYDAALLAAPGYGDAGADGSRRGVTERRDSCSAAARNRRTLARHGPRRRAGGLDRRRNTRRPRDPRRRRRTTRTRTARRRFDRGANRRTHRRSIPSAARHPPTRRHDRLASARRSRRRLSPVLRKLRVAEVADSGQTYGGHAYQDCLRVARESMHSIAYPRAGMEWHTDDGVTLTSSVPRCR